MVFIRQRTTAAHLLDVCWWIKITGFKKMPVEFARQQFAHCGSPSTGDSEDDHNYDALICFRLPIFSKRNAITTMSVQATGLWPV